MVWYVPWFWGHGLVRYGTSGKKERKNILVLFILKNVNIQQWLIGQNYY